MNMFTRKILFLAFTLLCGVAYGMDDNGGLKNGNPKRAKHTGELGNKCKNLIKIDKMLKDAFKTGKVNGIAASVPQFYGISSEDVQGVLAKVGFVLSKEWGSITDSLDKAARDDIFSSKKLPESFLVARSQLEEGMRVAWQKVVAENLIFTTLPELNEFIEDVAQSNHRLMVRSSGAMEDTATCANPGGNKTEINITPEQAAVTCAIESVICSYISKESLEQRLLLGDDTIFNSPITPCVAQEMVDATGTVPCSGVAFSQDASTGLDVTIIQGSYGFTAVTQADATYDTFYVAHDAYIYPIVKQKLFRNERSATSGALEHVCNPQELVTKPCLDRQQILALHHVVKVLAEKFECPVDVEFVAVGNNLFIVQTRPIVKTTQQAKPLFFDRAKIKDLPQQKVQSIVTNNGSLVVVEQQNEIIVAKTIDDALVAYRGQPTTKLVVVQQDAPAISHPAIAFRCAGVPVVHCAAMEQINDWLNPGWFAAKKVLGCDTQQGIIAMAQSNDELNGCVKEGWAMYPLPRGLSVLADDITGRTLQKIHILEASLGEKKSATKTRTVKELLDCVRTADTKSEAIAVLDELIG